MNESGIIPVEYKVLVKLDEIDQMSKGGIIFADTTRERLQYEQEKGTIAAIGGSAFEEWRDDEKERMIAGTKVLINKYSGTKLRGSDGVMYRLVLDKDITAIREES